MKKSNRLLPMLLAVTLSVGNILLLAAPASAATINTATIRLDRMAAGTNTTFRLLIKPTTASPTSLSINFNGSDATTWTSATGTVTGTSETDSTTQCVTDGYAALAGTHSYTTSSGSTIALTGITGMSSTTTTYCLDFTNAASLKTPTTATEYHPLITLGTDTTTVAVRVVTNDQILVTAVVPPTFNFSLGSNADAFTTNLSPSAVATTTGVTATVNTNAKSGWIAWAKDSSTGLQSINASKTIASTTPGTVTTLTSGTEGYALGITTIVQGSGTGTTTAATPYDATGGSVSGSGLDATLRPIASSTGTASTATFTMKERAAISSLTPAATDYADTITVIGAGNF